MIYVELRKDCRSFLEWEVESRVTQVQFNDRQELTVQSGGHGVVLHRLRMPGGHEYYTLQCKCDLIA